MNSREKQLMARYPLMNCGNSLEFQQRLQWLSEGMLRNHLSEVLNPKVDADEMELYRRFKTGGPLDATHRSAPYGITCFYRRREIEKLNQVSEVWQTLVTWDYWDLVGMCWAPVESGFCTRNLEELK